MAENQANPAYDAISFCTTPYPSLQAAYLMRILAFETSCDDTAAAVFDTTTGLRSSVLSSQHEIHAPFGGIVPELASRRHLELIWPVTHQALKQAHCDLEAIELVAATRGPGLVGSLLVGFTFAKALALVRGLPCVGVDHLAGHLLSCHLEQSRPDFPYTALIVSGGTTALYAVRDAHSFVRLGRTRDDAAGEAFDKVAKLLNLGYPGGPLIAALAAQGNPDAFAFPRAWLEPESLDFSFSGLKTSVASLVRGLRSQRTELPLADLCASFQEAVVEVLVAKTLRAARMQGHERVVLGGGVAANQHLRVVMASCCEAAGLQLFLPSPAFCTDNAAMIAVAGYHAYLANELIHPDSDAYARSPLS